MRVTPLTLQTPVVTFVYASVKLMLQHKCWCLPPVLQLRFLDQEIIWNSSLDINTIIKVQENALWISEQISTNDSFDFWAGMSRSLQLVLYLTGLLVLGCLVLFSSFQTFTATRSVRMMLSPSREAKDVPVKILLLAYGRTGSSLLGDILSSDKRTAFFYEPSGWVIPPDI